MDTNETYGKKTWRQPHKNDASNIEQVMEATPPQNSSCMTTYHLSQKLSTLDEPDMWDTAGEVRTNSWAIYSCGPLHMDEQKQDDQLEPIYNSSVPIQDIALKTSLERWTIETSGERGSGGSVLAARHDDDYHHWERYEPPYLPQLLVK